MKWSRRRSQQSRSTKERSRNAGAGRANHVQRTRRLILQTLENRQLLAADIGVAPQGEGPPIDGPVTITLSVERAQAFEPHSFLWDPADPSNDHAGIESPHALLKIEQDGGQNHSVLLRVQRNSGGSAILADIDFPSLTSTELFSQKSYNNGTPGDPSDDFITFVLSDLAPSRFIEVQARADVFETEADETFQFSLEEIGSDPNVQIIGSGLITVIDQVEILVEPTIATGSESPASDPTSAYDTEHAQIRIASAIDGLSLDVEMRLWFYPEVIVNGADFAATPSADYSLQRVDEFVSLQGSLPAQLDAQRPYPVMGPEFRPEHVRPESIDSNGNVQYFPASVVSSDPEKPAEDSEEWMDPYRDLGSFSRTEFAVPEILIDIIPINDSVEEVDEIVRVRVEGRHRSLAQGVVWIRDQSDNVDSVNPIDLNFLETQVVIQDNDPNVARLDPEGRAECSCQCTVCDSIGFSVDLNDASATYQTSGNSPFMAVYVGEGANGLAQTVRMELSRPDQGWPSESIDFNLTAFDQSDQPHAAPYRIALPTGYTGETIAFRANLDLPANDFPTGLYKVELSGSSGSEAWKGQTEILVRNTQSRDAVASSTLNHFSEALPPGWTFPFLSELVILDDQPGAGHQATIQYTQPNGEVDVVEGVALFRGNNSASFFSGTDGSSEFDSPPETSGQLRKMGSGYRLTHRNESYETFDSAGRMISFTDTHGDTTSFTLSSGAGGKLTIVDPLGRTTVITQGVDQAGASGNHARQLVFDYTGGRESTLTYHSNVSGNVVTPQFIVIIHPDPDQAGSSVTVVSRPLL